MILVLAIRTDGSPTQVAAFLDSCGAGGFAVRETASDGSNEHCHWYVEVEARNCNAFRTQFKRKSGLIGNRQYSIKEIGQTDVDVEAYHRYLCKGKDEATQAELVWSHSLLYTSEFMKVKHQEYWKENERLKKSKKVGIFEAVLRRCEARAISWDQRNEIALQYLNEIESRKKSLNMFAAKAAVNGLQIALCKDDQAKKLFSPEI